MVDISFNELTIIMAILAIIISYYGITSKKPRVFFKLDPVYDNNKWHLNLSVFNCGDKPAFNIKIRTNNCLENFIYKDRGLLNLKKKLSESKQSKFRDGLIKDIKSFNKVESVSRRYYRNLRTIEESEKVFKQSMVDLEECFSQTIQFISGNDESSIYMGEKANDSIFGKHGYLKSGLQIKANVMFDEEFRLDFFVKHFLKINILAFFYFYMFLIEIFYKEKYIFLDSENLKNKFMTFSILGFVQLDLNNGRFFINHNYEYSSKGSESYQYKAEDNEIVGQIEEISKSIKISNLDIFFKSHLYLVWEDLLTDSELLLLNSYKIKYLNDYSNYISLYSIIYEKECPENIKNNELFKEKYITLIYIIYKSKVLSIENKSDIELIAFDYGNKGIYFDCFMDIYSSIDKQKKKYGLVEKDYNNKKIYLKF
jgi:hypothetical protein